MSRPRRTVGMTLAATAIAGAAALASTPVAAHSAGINGSSGNPAAGGGATCANCHSGGGFAYDAPAVAGAASVVAGTTNAYTLNFTKATGGDAARAGFNLSATGGTLRDPNVADNAVRKIGAELTHGTPRVPSAGNFSWSFEWQAPEATGSYTFYLCANPVNLDGASSGDGAIQCAAVAVSVTNAAPVARDDGYSTAPDTTRSVAAPGVLANDTDLNGDGLTAALVAGPSNGTLSFGADGGFTYTPRTGFTGADTFSYRASDGTATSSAATVTMTIAANAAPVAASDAYATQRDQALTVAAPGVLANDTDADGNPLTATLVAGPANGNLALSPDGAFTYTPAAGFTGNDGFTYQAGDGTDQSAVTSVSVTVSAPPAGGGGGGVRRRQPGSRGSRCARSRVSRAA